MAWQQAGSLRGPQGLQGPKGDKGDAGAGIEIAGSVATYSALPTSLTAADAGSGYLVEADGLLYIWDGSKFPASGSGVAFQGPPGNDGATPTVEVGTTSTGAAGSSAVVSAVPTDTGIKLNFTIPKGDKGAVGETGSHGSDGAPGKDGTTWFHGSGAPGSVSGAVAGDYYVDDDDGTYYQLA